MQSVAGTHGVNVDRIGAAGQMLAMGGAQHNDLVAVGDLAVLAQHLVGEGHQILAGHVVVILIELDAFGAPAQSQPVEGVLVVGETIDRGSRALAGDAVHGGSGLRVGDDGLGIELLS